MHLLCVNMNLCEDYAKTTTTKKKAAAVKNGVFINVMQDTAKIYK